MLEFISSQLMFYLALVLVLFVPGAFLLLATRMYKEFSLLELFVLTFGSSIAVIDFLMILLGRSPLHITRISILVGMVIYISTCLGIYLNYKKKNQSPSLLLNQIPESNISRRSTFLIVLILFLTIFIKTIYFKDAIFPTVTDLGHHMYWTKDIATTGKLPIYEKADITADFTIGKPAPIADFIIGEHLIFAAIAIVSGADFFSPFPVLTLFLIHIVTVLAIFILARRLFENSKYRDTISIATLFLIGPLFAIASPQAKFVSGGVIGNDIGNLLIPIAILLCLKAFTEKRAAVLAYALFMGLGLAYTHHLSTFVFVFLTFFSVVAYALLNIKTFPEDLRAWLKMALHPSVLAVLAFAAIFVFFLYTPTYLNTKAIDTAVGAPSKSTRTGLTLTQLKFTAGEARYAFAFIGIILLFFARKIGRYNQAFLIGWIVALTLMSLTPNLLLVDIPSNRIASYIVYPVSIIAAYALIRLLTELKGTIRDKNYLSPTFFLATFFLMMIFVATGGFYDNAQTLNSSNSSSDAIQTYAASTYLTNKISDGDIILKDHNYLSGDAWIKLFFMKDYNYPLSRGFFKRYEDATKNREQCTNFMISAPNAAEAGRCFDGTHTNFIMINPKMDSEQFKRSDKFWQVYTGDAVGIFYKTQ